MKPSKTITPAQWMIAPPVTRIMKALGEGKALFVGGCVRNELLGEEVGDIDIATMYTPDQVQKILGDKDIRTIPTGIDHGTVTAVADGQGFEITTLRRDVETDGRRAMVAFTDKWEEDAQRRDFTMNTLLADAKGHIYDPTGQGLADLEKRHVRFVGEPRERIAEDYLRILRFFRFHGYYGAGEPDAQALAECKSAADKIETLSKERITQEFFKILSLQRPVAILDLMFENRVMKKISDYNSELLVHICEFQNRFGLAALAPRLMMFENLDKYCLIPKVFQKNMKAISEVLELPDLNADHNVKVAIYKHGRAATAQALMFELATDRVMNAYANDALKIIQKWDIPTFPVSGEDLMKQGLEEGPELGQRLIELENEWIANGFRIP